MTDEQKFKELIDECMRIKYCDGISCYDCSMHSESVSFRNRYYCSCILVAIESVIEESGVDYDGK